MGPESVHDVHQIYNLRHPADSLGQHLRGHDRIHIYDSRGDAMLFLGLLLQLQSLSARRARLGILIAIV